MSYQKQFRNCPFCDSSNCRYASTKSHTPKHMVICCDCAASGPTAISQLAAFNAWRRRPEAENLKLEAEELMCQRDRAFESAKGFIGLIADIPCHCGPSECVRCKVRRETSAFFAEKGTQ